MFRTDKIMKRTKVVVKNPVIFDISETHFGHFLLKDIIFFHLERGKKI